MSKVSVRKVFGGRNETGASVESKGKGVSIQKTLAEAEGGAPKLQAALLNSWDQRGSRRPSSRISRIVWLRAPGSRGAHTWHWAELWDSTTERKGSTNFANAGSKGILHNLRRRSDAASPLVQIPRNPMTCLGKFWLSAPRTHEDLMAD